jgi:hypothetical protein
MITTKLKNEYGRKNIKFFVSLNLTTTCNLEEREQVMNEFQCLFDKWKYEDHIYSEISVYPKLHALIYDLIKKYSQPEGSGSPLPNLFLPRN